MRYFTKEKILSLFFLILSCLLGIRMLGSEAYFLVKLFVGLISLGLFFLVTCLIVMNAKDLKTLIKKTLIFILFSLSFFTLKYALPSEILTFYLEETVSGGVTLFFIYFAFFAIFKLSLKINSLVSIISLLLIPAFALSNIIYSAETFAVFGFLTLGISSVLFILQLRQNNL